MSSIQLEVVDPQIRYIVATEVSKRREIGYARSIIAKGKKNVSANPSYVVTDSLTLHTTAIRKELDNWYMVHVRINAIKNEFVNRPIERVHNEMRKKLSARRVLGNDKSVQNFMELFQIHHNLVCSHMGLDGKTPTEYAGISSDLGCEKYRTLIQNVSTKSTFVTVIGKRIEYVGIDSSKERIRVVQKGWLDKKILREINDILSVYGFECDVDGGKGFWI